MNRTLIALVALCAVTACGSTYTILDRESIQVSPNSETVARTMLPHSERHPQLVQHLALAEAMYQKQLTNLRERRNKVRARKRDLQFAAYGIMGATGLGVSGLAVGSAAGGGDSTKSLIGAGAMSLVGLGIGTVLQLTAAMQEEPSVADDKVRTLQRAHEAMLDRVRTLDSHSAENAAEAAQTQAQIAAAIESFISVAQELNVKG